MQLDCHVDQWLQVPHCNDSIGLQNSHLLEITFIEMMITVVRRYFLMGRVFVRLGQMDVD